MSEQNAAEIEEIWDVFGEESKENLDLVENCLLSLETNPKDAGEIGALFRAMHTIKGSARMMGLTGLETLGHRAEDLVSLVRDQMLDVDETLISLLLGVADCLRRMIDQSVSHRSDPSDSEADSLIHQLNALITHSPSLDLDKKNQVTLSTINPAEAPPEAAVPQEDDLSQESEDDIEMIDLASDPVSVRIFFEMADDEFTRIASSINSVLQGQPEAIEQMASSTDSLQYAAGQMGYQALEAVLQQLSKALQNKAEWAFEIYNPLIASLSNELESLRRTYPFLSSETTFQILPDDTNGYTKSVIVETTSPIKTNLVSMHQLPDAPAATPTPDTSEAMKETMTAISDILGDQAFLHRMITRMERADFPTTFTNLVRKHQGNFDDLRKEFEPLLLLWQEQTALISRTEKKIAASISQLHETVRSHYLIPVAILLEPMDALINELATRSYKKIVPNLDGGSVEIDPSILAILDSCLRLLVEMSVKFSIESPDDRCLAGKPEQAHLSISVLSQAGNLQIILTDDGCGIQDGLVIQTVREILKQKQGSLLDQSNELGVSLRLRLPLHQSVIDGMVVRIGNVFYMIAIDAIQRILRQDHSDLCHSSADEKQTLLRLGNDMLPIYYFSTEAPPAAIPILIVIEGASGLFALRVDEIIGQQRVSLLPLPQNMTDIQYAVGCVILGEGEIGVALDVNSAFEDRWLY